MRSLPGAALADSLAPGYVLSDPPGRWKRPNSHGHGTLRRRLLRIAAPPSARMQMEPGSGSGDNPESYNEYDWDAYYADYTSLMKKFLPIAHDTQVKV